MASLTATLALTSTDVTSDALSLSTSTGAVNVIAPIVNVSRVAANTSGGADITIKGDISGNAQVYIKHTGKQADGSTATTNELIVKFGSTDTLRLRADEFAFFPCKSDVLVKIISQSSHTIQTEYAYYTNG